MDNIAAGIVLYNPDDYERFKKAFISVVEQFSKIYVFDNSNIKVKLPVSSDKIVYLTEHKNRGIAYALNCIMDAADKDGYKWVVTMDQDSIVPTNMLIEYRKHINDTKVAIICPQVIDKRRIYMKPKAELNNEYVKFCITSGSCTSTKAWRNVGKFDACLFIDLVDNEFCKRIVVSGYKILQLNNVILNQEFGNIVPKRISTQRFWLFISEILHNVNFAKLGYKKNVNPLRIYYTNRNIIYVNKKLSDYGKTGYKENYHVNSYVGFWLCFNVPSVLRSKNKLETIKAIRQGRHDGLSMKVSKWVR